MTPITLCPVTLPDPGRCSSPPRPEYSGSIVSESTLPRTSTPLVDCPTPVSRDHDNPWDQGRTRGPTDTSTNVLLLRRYPTCPSGTPYPPRSCPHLGSAEPLPVPGPSPVLGHQDIGIPGTDVGPAQGSLRPLPDTPDLPPSFPRCLSREGGRVVGRGPTLVVGLVLGILPLSVVFPRGRPLPPTGSPEPTVLREAPGVGGIRNPDLVTHVPSSDSDRVRSVTPGVRYWGGCGGGEFHRPSQPCYRGVVSVRPNPGRPRHLPPTVVAFPPSRPVGLGTPFRPRRSLGLGVWERDGDVSRGTLWVVPGVEGPFFQSLSSSTDRGGHGCRGWGRRCPERKSVRPPRLVPGRRTVGPVGRGVRA